MTMYLFDSELILDYQTTGYGEFIYNAIPHNDAK